MKKKILIISIITIIILIIVSVFIFYKVQDGKKALEVSSNDTNNTQEEIIKETEEKQVENTEEKIEENTNENIIENTKEEIKQDTKEQNNKNTNENKKQETQKNNNGQVVNTPKEEKTQKPQAVQQTQQVPKVDNTKEEVKTEEPKKETIKIDLSKYDRYENALNGGYKAYKKSDSEMAKLKGLIEDSIKKFGYTNVNVIPSDSIKNTQYFTANKTNVENKVYNSEDFTIYYYAEAEYHISADGTETVFQYRSYIKVK